MARNPLVPSLQLPLAQWPEEDRCLWMRAHQPAGLFDDLGPASTWTAVTWTKTTKGYGRFLAWLGQHHPAAFALSVAERINKELVAAYVRHLQERTAGYSALSYVEDFMRACRILLPGAPPDWLSPLHNRLRAQTRPVRDKRAALVAVDACVGRGVALMHQAETTPSWSARRRAVAYRDGLAIALLAYRPLRMKNFSRLRIGAELCLENGIWQITVASDDTKTGKDYEAAVPAALTSALVRYLEAYRPILLSGERNSSPRPTDALWVSETGTAWEQGAMSRRIANAMEAAFGCRIPPHWFRDAAATTIAIDAPRHVRDAHLVLGHGTLQTTERHYIQAQSLVAGRRHQAMLDSLRSRPHATKAHTAAEPQETSACAS